MEPATKRGDPQCRRRRERQRARLPAAEDERSDPEERDAAI